MFKCLEGWEIIYATSFKMFMPTKLLLLAIPHILWLLLGVLILSEQRSLAGAPLTSGGLGHLMSCSESNPVMLVVARNEILTYWLLAQIQLLPGHWKLERREKVEEKQTLHTYHQFKPYSICVGLISVLAALQKGKHHLSSKIIWSDTD